MTVAEIVSVSKDLRKLRMRMPGPVNSLYEGGNFIMSIHIPNDWPLRPPIFKFLTNIWHPNFSMLTNLV
jgi:ubiquitin-protein ligase